MGYGTPRLLALSWVAALLAGCEEPLQPNLDQALVQSQADPRTTGDPSATATSAVEIVIFWSDNSNNEAGWEVHRSKTGRAGTYTLLASTGAGITSHSDQGLQPTTAYCYRIRSFRIVGRKTSFSAFTIPACATTLAPPAAPSNTTAIPAYSSAVAVTWTDNTQFEFGFRVERSAGTGGPWEFVTFTDPNVTSYIDGGRPSETEVCYRVFAAASSESAPSNADCTTPPAGATNLKATSLDDGNVDLTWTDNSKVEDGYEMRRWNGGSWEIVGSLPPNTGEYRDALTPDAIPYYVVLAQKDGGHSDQSNAATIPPRAPSDVQAIPGGSTTVWVYWSNTSSNAGGFRIERSKDAGLTWETVFDGSPEEGLAWGFGEESEQQVCYRVFAYNSEGSSQPSETACTVPPAAPTGLVPISIDDQTVEHRWRDNSGFEDGYELWLLGSDEWGNLYYYPVSLPLNTTSYHASSSQGVYGILALNDGGYSDWAFPEWGGSSASLQRLVPNTGRPPASAQRTPPRFPIRQGVGR